MVKRSGDIYEKSANIQKWKGGHGGTDSLLLVPLAKMRSSIYEDFREGPPTLVNIVVVNA